MRTAVQYSFPPSFEHASEPRRATVENIRTAAELNRPVIINGRILNIRDHGVVFFVDLQDYTGKIQLSVSTERCPAIASVRRGDVVEVTGTTFGNKRDPLLVEASDIKVISRTHHDYHPGTARSTVYKDPIARAQDLSFNPTAREYFRSCALFKAGLRAALSQQEFIEFDTGTLYRESNRGVAEVFKTLVKYGSLKCNLRVTAEMRLKMLLAADYGRVFEIAKSFRNEGIAPTYTPEFTLLEVYQADAQLQDMMKLLENIVSSAVLSAFKQQKFVVEQRQGEAESFDVTEPWPRVSFQDFADTQKVFPFDLFDPEQVKSHLANDPRFAGCKIYRQFIDKIILTQVVHGIRRPSFLVDLPPNMSPLAKVEPGARCCTRALPVANGMILGDVYEDENDPLLLGATFARQAAEIKAATGDEEFVDTFFLDLLRLGMPRSSSIGLGLDRFLLLFKPAKLANNVRENLLVCPGL